MKIVTYFVYPKGKQDIIFDIRNSEYLILKNCNLNKNPGIFLSVDRKLSKLRRLENIADFLVDFSGDFVEAKIMRQ